MPADKKVCTDCAGSGFSDKVGGGIWAMEPAQLVCEVCGGRGWVTRDGKMIVVTLPPIDPENWVYKRFTEKL